ncbi:hypothetical protein [Chitinophaga sp. RAB17]|uniref:hypothetical protein n=1 Tax=Chitinophaga sp. RAB17 TaxID=3233049 RepID=UPI003F921132
MAETMHFSLTWMTGDHKAMTENDAVTHLPGPQAITKPGHPNTVTAYLIQHKKKKLVVIMPEKRAGLKLPVEQKRLHVG